MSSGIRSWLLKARKNQLLSGPSSEGSLHFQYREKKVTYIYTHFMNYKECEKLRGVWMRLEFAMGLSGLEKTEQDPTAPGDGLEVH